MSTEFDAIVIATQRGGTDPGTRPGATSTGATSTGATSTGATSSRHRGLVLETALEAWIACAATKNMIGRRQMLPRLAAGLAVLSAISGLTIFATLQSSADGWARVLVAIVALATAAITALQSWGAARMKSLTEQAARFHDLHRSIIADLEASPDLDEAYATKRETELKDLKRDMSEPPPSANREAEEHVGRYSQMLFPHLFPREPAAPE